MTLSFRTLGTASVVSRTPTRRMRQRRIPATLPCCSALGEKQVEDCGPSHEYRKKGWRKGVYAVSYEYLGHPALVSHLPDLGKKHRVARHVCTVDRSTARHAGGAGMRKAGLLRAQQDTRRPKPAGRGQPGVMLAITPDLLCKQAGDKKHRHESATRRAGADRTAAR